MDTKVSEQIKEIKKSNKAYHIKSSRCKLAMMREECFGELEGAIELCKLAIRYESLISPPWCGQEIEVKALKGHLRYIQRKSTKLNRGKI